MRFISIVLFLLSFHLQAAESDLSSSSLYVTLQPPPQQLFVGEIFAVSLKVVNTSKASRDISYKFSGARSVERFVTTPDREWLNSSTFIEKLYFKVLGVDAVLPRITPILKTRDGSSYSLATDRTKLSVTQLRPLDNYASILADSFTVDQVKTTSFDLKHNITIFIASATRSDLSTFKLKGVHSQGFESESSTPYRSSLTYYAVIPKHLDKLEFSYFNLQTKKFERVSLDIVVQSDSVSTQSDLRPTQSAHIFIKQMVGGGLIVLFLLLFIFRRSKWYLFFAIVVGIYTATVASAMQYVCVEKDSAIYLLPMSGSTIFELTDEQKSMQKQGSIDGYVKVKLSDSKVGWISDEDVCKN